jgi:prepilin-type processing-associated H-X9-DG protein
MSGTVMIEHRAPARVGLSLVELLVVIVIVAALAALLLLGTRWTLTRSDSARCLANLRQVGLAANAFTEDHRGMLPAPIVEWGARTWAAQLAPYVDEDPQAVMRGEFAERSVLRGCPGWMRSPYRAYWAGRTDLDWPVTWDCGYGMAVLVSEPSGQHTLSGAQWTTLTNVPCVNIASVSLPSSRVFIADSGPWWLWPSWINDDPRAYGGDFLRHRGRAGALFYDGHTALLDRAGLTTAVERPWE